MRILLTRPAPDAARTASSLRAAGHDVTVDALLAIARVAFDAPAGDYGAVAATSANALRIAGSDPRLARFKALPLFALGDHVAEVARAAGFGKIESAAGDAAALAALLARRLPAGARVLYLAGEARARDLAAMTAPAALSIDTVVVYRAEPAERLREETAQKLAAGEFDAVLHFSPRSAETLLALARAVGLDAALRPLRHLCLSDAVAAKLAPAGLATEVAATPDEKALLALLGA